MKQPSIAGIVLAAGASSRLGQPKQLLRWKGELLVNRVTRLAHEAGLSPLILVLGAHAEAIESQLVNPPDQIVRAAEWEEGMAASLRAGIARLMDIAPDTAAALLMVVDQPALEVRNLEKLISTWKNSQLDILYSQYQKGSGVPAIVDAHLFPRLLELRGDRGAKAMIAHDPSLVTSTLTFDLGHLDVDRPMDWDRWTAPGHEPG